MPGSRDTIWQKLLETESVPLELPLTKLPGIEFVPVDLVPDPRRGARPGAPAQTMLVPQHSGHI